jgi:hypothetical protein
MIEVDRKCGDDCIFLYTDGVSSTACSRQTEIQSPCTQDEFDPSEDTVRLLQEHLFDSKALDWTTSCEIASIIAQPCWQVHKIMEAFLESQEETFEAPKTVGGGEEFANLVPDFGDYRP